MGKLPPRSHRDDLGQIAEVIAEPFEGVPQ
jgi:hypothetical protein